jgi:hypothetical protein
MLPIKLSGDHPIAASFRRAEVHEQHLIFLMIDDRVKVCPAFRQIHRRHLTLKYRILEMIPIGSHFLEHHAQPLFVADVVADQVAHAHTTLIGAFRALNCIL